MTKEKKTAHLVKLLICILAVLTFSLFMEATAGEAENIVSVEESYVEASSNDASDAPDDLFPDANGGGAVTRKETDILIHLINAEAYGLSYKAKVAVGQVVMNRWTGPYYGDDLLAIMTAPYQFTPIYDGSAYEKEIEPDSIQAAYAVLKGTGVKELTEDTYYFVDPDFTEDKTIEQKMEFVCEIEGIHFYKPPTK
ncbi:cell wall hydrolase [Sinanaerobacter chloroacetimidivorans]|uniref:Cell wall hydrolase n=1 Tax=Sinanaerobacter chloroacetimidivorans TaxID=2818044 RepID=A0A8J7W549_9FIRM|nr:cell wall hydrolase [Sinanaerobacter chloroacetimidivorans]MBR0599370.1 cell wall hydrolase [Sinanaerobacter chloroacetimidivorans]